MSQTAGSDYGFVLCRLNSRDDVTALENALCGKTNVYTTGVTLPFDNSVIEQMMAVMRARWPGVRIEPRDVRRTAEERGMTEMEVIQSLSLVEMFVPNDGTDAYFEIFTDNALVSIPYAHRAPRLDAALLRVWEYLEALERELSCVTFDPQHRRVISLERDFETVKAKYAYLAERSAQVDGGRPSKWWKLW